MKKALGFEGNCTGCSACYAVCPKNAITMSMDEKGFFSAKTNEDCINCGICGQVCICNDKEIKLIDFNTVEQYSAYLKEPEIHDKCASGGLAYGFYRNAVQNNYKAIGTYYDDQDNIAKAGIAHISKDINKFRGSKYIQADCSEAIREAVNSEEKYIICGTPCQIYGLKKASKLKGTENNFIFVDIYCHGVPSYLFWKKYLQEITNGKKINNLTFRDHSHGWHKYYLSIEFEKGKYVEERSRDNFYKIFDDSYVMSDACYHCQICQAYGVSDIRIGDLWNRELCKDDVFKSYVCIGTEKGRLFWHQVRAQFINQPIMANESGRSAAPKKNALPEKLSCIRNIAFERVNRNDKLRVVIKKYRAKEKIKKKLQRKKMVLKVYMTLKRVIKFK